MSGLPKRNELPVSETWTLCHIFETQEKFEEAVNQLTEKIGTFKQAYEGNLTDHLTVAQAIVAYHELQILADHVGRYSEIGYTSDRFNEVYEKNATLADNVQGKLDEELGFFVPELLELDSAEWELLKQEEAMKPFLCYLDQLAREKKTLFDAKIESILGAFHSSLFGQEKLYNLWKFEDITFEDFEVDGKVYSNSFAGFEQDYEVHPNIEVRHKAWESFHDGLARYQNVAAGNYLSLVQNHKKIANLRGFDSSIDYQLFGQEVTKESYHQIIDTLMTEWAPVMRRYAKMLQKQLGLEKISLADIKASFSPDDSKEISIPEARKMVEAALTPLGEEYMAVVRQTFDERRIDYPMSQGKVTGGFCTSPYGKGAYVLLNWTGLLNEVLVLAHELGHAANFSMSAKHQTCLSFVPSLYFVEAPSTCNEVITCNYLINQPIDAKTKRGLLAGFVTGTYFHNMVTHLLEAAFQRKVYEASDRGDLLNARVLNGFFRDCLEEFWGNAVEINEGAELTWMRQPHYYDGLYSYTYSAGLTIGTQMGQLISTNDQDAIEKWNAVLKEGGSKSPLDLALMTDVDMSTPEPLRATIAYVSGLLDQIEALSE